MNPLNVYMYLDGDSKNRKVCVYAERDDDITYTKSVTIGQVDDTDAYACMFGMAARLVAPFVADKSDVKFYGSQDGLIKAFNDSDMTKFGKIEKTEDNKAQTENIEGELETRLIRNLNTAKRLAEFSLNPFGYNHMHPRPMFGFPVHPFGYMDERLFAPMRDMLLPLGSVRRHGICVNPGAVTVRPEPPKTEKTEVKTEDETVRGDTKPIETEAVAEVETEVNPDTTDLSPEQWFESLSPEDKLAYLKKFAGMM